jgi:anti-anti-sigma factor
MQRADADEAHREAGMPLMISSDEGKGFVTIHVGGSLDSNTYPQLEEHVTAVRAKKPYALVFDLKDLNYISSAGVRVIVAAQRAMKAANGSLAIINVPPQIRRVFEIIMALPAMNVFESVEELDNYLAAIQKKVLEEGKT